MYTMSAGQSVAGPGDTASVLLPATAQDLAHTLEALAHDLRSPLTVIRAAAQILDRHLRSPSGDPAVMTAHAALITEATNRLGGMVEYLHVLAPAAAGHPTVIDRRPTDLVVLARQVAREHELLWSGRAITVTCEAAEVLGNWNVGQLARVLANLLANALKYSGPDAPVRVAVSHQEEAWALLEVTDHGIGIPSGDLPHIFTPFYRAANAAAQAEGTGMGLASVWALVAQHGGTVAAASVVGRGTTVTVRLPRQPPDGS